MATYEVGFSIDNDLHQLKREGKINESHANTFKKEAKQFTPTLCNHILSKSLLTSYFARAARCQNPINQAVISDTNEKRFHNFLQKLIDGKLIISLFADEAKSEFYKCVSYIVRKNKALFRSYDDKLFNNDGFYIEYLKYSIIVSPSPMF